MRDTPPASPPAGEDPKPGPGGPRALAPSAGTAPEIASQARESFAGRRVLLVEDNVVNQEVAADLLRGHGLVVEIAGHGAEALERLAAGRYDLVLMDVQMPVMDGLATTRALRARFGTALPVVAMTANAWADRRTCLEAGMDDHLAKPIDPDLLQAGLQRWLAPAPASARVDAPPVPQAFVVPAPSDLAAAPSLEVTLAGIEGLDLPMALRSVGGRVALLQRILRKFVDHYGGSAGVLPDPALPDGRAALASSCHALRGACATIGANPLAGALQALEAASLGTAANAADLAAAAARIRVDLDRLLRSLARALDG